jgi:hypothetical protein
MVIPMLMMQRIMERIPSVGCEQQVIRVSHECDEVCLGHVQDSMDEQIAQRVQRIEILPQCVGERME